MWDKIKALFGGKKAPAAEGDMSAAQEDTKYCSTCNTQVPTDHAHDAAPQQPASNETDAADMNTESDM